MTLAENTILENRYRIERLLSQGGMGSIYRAFDTNLKTPVAIKENFFQTPQSIRQFEQEALILARLRHPSLPRVIHHFSTDKRQYLVMDFIEGHDLWEMVKQAGRPLDEQPALTYLIQICDAVDYLHRQNPPIIHRDIKPQNIKITPEDQAVLVDFGIAKVGHDDSRTTSGAQAVTPGFSPPEQYSGVGTTPVSDVYALGATLYAVLVGKKPPDSVSRMVGGANYEAPHHLNPKLSQAVSQAIEHAMQIRPADRPPSAKAWQADLEAVLDELTRQPNTVDHTESPTILSSPGSELINLETIPPSPDPDLASVSVPTGLPWGRIGLGLAALSLIAGAMMFLNRGQAARSSGVESEVAVSAIEQAAPTEPAVDPEATVKTILTASARQARSEEATRQAQATPTPTITPSPTPTETPLPPTDTPTPEPARITLASDVEARTGPGQEYDRAGTLTAGQAIEIVGRNEDGSWWQIDFPAAPDGLAWVAATMGEAQNSQAVIIAAIPPTPTPPFPTPTATPNFLRGDPPDCPVSNSAISDPGDFASPYTDIVQVSSNLFQETLTVSFILRDLPAELTFNREGVLRGRVEYAWTAYIDIDGNSDTGWWGSEYALEAKTLIKSASTPPYTQPILIGAPARVWQCDDTGHCNPLSDASLTVIPESNELILTGAIPGISGQSRLGFETTDYFAGYDRVKCLSN